MAVLLKHRLDPRIREDDVGESLAIFLKLQFDPRVCEDDVWGRAWRYS